MSLKYGHTVSSLYFAEDWVDSWYDHTNKIMVMTWFNLSNNVHYRQVYQAQVAASKIFKPRALIIDTSRAFGVPHPNEHKWLESNVFPEAKRINFEFIINIFPKNSISKTGVKSIIDMGKKHGFNIFGMHTLEEAYDFINSQ